MKWNEGEKKSCTYIHIYIYKIKGHIQDVGNKEEMDNVLQTKTRLKHSVPKTTDHENLFNSRSPPEKTIWVLQNPPWKPNGIAGELRWPITRFIFSSFVQNKILVKQCAPSVHKHLNIYDPFCIGHLRNQTVKKHSWKYCPLKIVLLLIKIMQRRIMIIKKKIFNFEKSYYDVKLIFVDSRLKRKPIHEIWGKFGVMKLMPLRWCWRNDGDRRFIKTKWHPISSCSNNIHV